VNARIAGVLLLALLAPAVAGCPRKSERAPGGGGEPASATGAPPSSSERPAAAAIALDVIAGFGDCTLGHRGPLLDLGDPTARANYGARARENPPETMERDGATWARVAQKTLAMTFVLDGLPGAYENPLVAARVRGGSAKSVSVYLNDKAVGMWPLTKGEARLVEARGAEDTLLPGENTLSLRFNGAGRGATEDLAEIDWIHVGSPEVDGAYAAPTRADALVSARVGGVPKRAISLRASSFIRCGGELPSGAQLEAAVGLAGATDGEVEVRLMRDRLPAQTLASYRLGPADAGAWRPIRVSISDFAEKSALGAIVLAAKSVTKGGRVLFAEPKVVVSPRDAARAMPTSRGVILVILGDVSPRGLGLHGGPRALPELSALAAGGVVFDAQRATTSVPAGAVASMLTGRAARAHGVFEYDRKLPASITTIADAARQGGVVAAMFTANPLTFGPFGFDRAWETFEAHAPADAPATAVFDRAASWIEAHKAERFLAVVHARGGHPPWDVSPEHLKTLPPETYTGGIDPKHAAELLAKARRVPPVLRYAEQDRTRTWALYDVALADHDAALGRLLAALRAAGRDADTTVIVTSDVAVDEAAHVPFGEGESLDEALLRVPLVVRPAAEGRDEPPAGTHVGAVTSGADVARTVLGALGLAPPASFGGVDLWRTATRGDAAPARPLVATLGERFSLRWGSFVLVGTGEREPKLCNLSLEPVCITDVRQTHPYATEALQRVAWDLLAQDARPARESPSIDPVTAAALKAWGR
jgi:arylsulfatase A-like enzyme